MIRGAALLVASALVGALAGCSGERGEDSDLGRRTDAQDDYRLFAARCSKCHSLARPLNSGIDDDEHWKRYVARMRRQPGSGISEQDSVAILRFLHLYSIEQRRKKSGESVDLQAVPADAAAPGNVPPWGDATAPGDGSGAPGEPR
jgi:hypothetical protein